MKYTTATLALLALLFTAGANTSHAQTSGTTGSLTWSFNGGTLTISGEGAMPNYGRVSAQPWFDYASEITAVEIGNGVTSIGKNAFTLTTLGQATIPSSVETIGIDAFSYTDLKQITIPNSVKSIGNNAFGYCEKLASVTIGSSVEVIGSNAFAETSLTQIAIPNSVKTIGDDAFSNLALTQVILQNQ
jgi:hypothetical protein